MSDDLTRAIADKVAETIRAVDGDHTMGAGALGDEIAAALAPLIEALVREARADECEQTARKFQFNTWMDLIKPGDLPQRLAIAQRITDWLRERAEEVRRG